TLPLQFAAMTGIELQKALASFGGAYGLVVSLGDAGTAGRPGVPVAALQAPDTGVMAQLDLPQILTTEPIEHLDEDQLIGQPGVKPDHDFIVLGESSERIFTPFQILPSLLQGAEAGVGHEAGAGLPPCFRVQTSRRWSFEHQITIN
ncbi:MAG: hypothetical protein HYU27_01315, partial [Acidobacteria bacterium]|nr:hypothetical protein [Acidobacteriota bacterium]